PDGPRLFVGADLILVGDEELGDRRQIAIFETITRRRRAQHHDMARQMPQRRHFGLLQVTFAVIEASELASNTSFRTDPDESSSLKPSSTSSDSKRTDLSSPLAVAAGGSKPATSVVIVTCSASIWSLLSKVSPMPAAAPSLALGA